MGSIVSQITSLAIVYSIVYSDADQRKHQTSASLAFVRGIHRGPVNSPHKWPVTRKIFPFDDVIMMLGNVATGNVGQNAHRHLAPPILPHSHTYQQISVMLLITQFLYQNCHVQFLVTLTIWLQSQKCCVNFKP